VETVVLVMISRGYWFRFHGIQVEGDLQALCKTDPFDILVTWEKSDDDKK